MASRRPVFIHLHIPKNAGTTLSRMLKIKFGVWPPHKLHKHTIRLGCYDVPYERRMRTIAELSESDRAKICFFEAHMGYGMHEHLPEPHQYITVLREPVDRALSVYYYMIEKGHMSADISLEEFIRSGDVKRVWWVDNAQVRYLAGESGDILDTPHGQVDPAMLDVAKERLESFLWTGVMDRYDASLLLLAKRMGWSRTYYGRSNVTSVRKKRDEEDPAMVELLQERNQLDIELHRWAVERIDAEIAAEGPEFLREIERFREKNKRYNATFGRAYDLLPKARRALKLRSPSAS